MEDLIKQMEPLLGTGGSLTLTIKNQGAKVCVTAQFNIATGKEIETLPAILIKGSAEEIDKHLATYLKEGVRKIQTTFIDGEAFEAAIAAKAASKGKGKEAPAKAEPTLMPTDDKAPVVKEAPSAPKAKEVPSAPVVPEVVVATATTVALDDFDEETADDTFDVPEGEEPALAVNSVPGNRPIEVAPTTPAAPAPVFSDDDDF